MNERWTTHLGGQLQQSTPAVGESHVFVDSLDRTFYAVSLETGDVVWTVERTGSLSDSSPLVANDRVYVGSGGGSVYALELRDGRTVWRFDGSSAVTSSPAVVDGTVYVGRNDGRLLALDDRADGREQWRTDLGASIYTDVAYSWTAELCYVTTNDGRISAHDPADGEQVWQQSVGRDVGSSSPVVDDDRGVVYFASNELMAYDLHSGAPEWATTFFGTCAGASPVFDDTAVYAAAADGTAYAIPHDGPRIRSTPAWTHGASDTIVSDLALSKGFLVFVTIDGGLGVLDAESGQLETRMELPGNTRSSPAVADGEVYVGTDTGAIVQFVGGPLETGEPTGNAEE